ncbi:hypothetical protein TI04_11910 [Achromatium sp. WMS2]|nr:hypothetical protein TI04_11910 [Achromatium sp. WMS2]
MFQLEQLNCLKYGYGRLLVFLFIIWMWAGLTAADTGRKYALVAGISDYNNASGIGRLKYARADAEALAQALKQAGYRVQLVVDHSVVKGFLLRTLRQLAGFFAALLTKVVLFCKSIPSRHASNNTIRCPARVFCSNSNTSPTGSPSLLTVSAVTPYRAK